MKYFILDTEVEPKIVGIKDGAGQLRTDEKIDKLFNEWHSHIFLKLSTENKDWWKVWSKHELYAIKPLEGIIIRKEAKKTDFIGGHNLRGFYVNEKLKNILESFNLPNHRFIKTNFNDEKSGKTISGYWRFVYDLDTGENTVDFQKSEFDFRNYFQEFGSDFYREINSYDDYLNVYYETRRGLRASKLVFNKNFNNNLDFLSFNFLTPRLYISERLKNKMEEENITGCFSKTLERDKWQSEFLNNVHTELIIE